MIAARLAAADVKTVGELKAIGPAETYRRVRRKHPAPDLYLFHPESKQTLAEGVESWSEGRRWP